MESLEGVTLFGAVLGGGGVVLFGADLEVWERGAVRRTTSLQFLKAPFPIWIRLARTEIVKFSQLAKAPSPIKVTLSGI